MESMNEANGKGSMNEWVISRVLWEKALNN